ncbi:MAG: hypothetical protein OEY52_02560 [Gammaproteobacteria bacterium]|nr:hypothetical protein [Gammaproteobacteria bacterium]
MSNLNKLKTIGLLSLFAIITACSSDSNPPASSGSAPASYAGANTEASVDSTNGEKLAESMMDGSSGSKAAGNITGGDTEDKEQLVGVIRHIRDAIEGVDTSNPTFTGSDFAEVISVPASTETSPCGGTMSTSYTVDTVSGQYSMTMTFSNFIYCTDKSKMNGSMSVTGGFDPSTYKPLTMKATFTALTYTDASESMTMTGTMDMETLSTVSYRATMNLDMRDNNANETYRLVNYITTVTEDAATNPTKADMTISGKFYHPTYGFITVNTTTALHFVYPDLNPTTGVVVLTGAGGSKATMTMLTKDTYKLEVDTNGDSTIDVTKNCTWSTSTCTAI